MTIRLSPFFAPIMVVLLCGLATGAAPAARDFEFRHENVLGTSLELCVRADNEEAACLAEARVLNEIDRLAADLQRLRSGKRIPPLAGDRRPTQEGLRRPVRAARRQRPMAREE